MASAFISEVGFRSHLAAKTQSLIGNLASESGSECRIPVSRETSTASRLASGAAREARRPIVLFDKAFGGLSVLRTQAGDVNPERGAVD